MYLCVTNRRSRTRRTSGSSLICRDGDGGRERSTPSNPLPRVDRGPGVEVRRDDDDAEVAYGAPGFTGELRAVERAGLAGSTVANDTSRYRVRSGPASPQRNAAGHDAPSPVRDVNLPQSRGRAASFDRYDVRRAEIPFPWKGYFAERTSSPARVRRLRRDGTGRDRARDDRRSAVHAPEDRRTHGGLVAETPTSTMLNRPTGWLGRRSSRKNIHSPS